MQPYKDEKIKSTQMQMCIELCTGENTYPRPFEYSFSFTCKVVALGLECHFWPPRNIFTQASLTIARLNTGTKHQPLLWQGGLRQP